MRTKWTRRRLLYAAGPAGAWVALAGCETRPTTDSPDDQQPDSQLPDVTKLAQPLADIRLDLPHLTGHRGYEAEACVAMVARHAGLQASPDDIFDDSGLSPTLGRGCAEPEELHGAMQRLGFAPGELAQQSWEQVLATIVDDLQAGLPTILQVTPFVNEPNASPRPRGPWVVITGCIGNNLRFHDPASSDGAHRSQPAANLLAPQHSGLRTSHTQPLQIQRSQRAHRPIDFSRRIRRLRAELSRHGLHVTMEEPFVVVGDDSPDKLASYSQRIVRWAVDLLRKAYFNRDPQALVEIWLLGTDESYRHWATTRWGDPPTTPYGYYDPAADVLVMNISTGGGTLVHELVHPFIATNFPRCPKWFDEGLASLYEQSSERNGNLVGLPNWRLAGLHDALRQKTLPSFKTLCDTGNRFYADDPGTNYAQARYLCYWLQEAGLLNRFYHAFVASVEDDPTGYKTLQEIIRTTDMIGFQRRWSKAMLQLQYP